jgi:hypothetical protein
VVVGDAVAKSDIRNIFYCINTKDKKICYCDKDYTVNVDDIITAEDAAESTNSFIFYCINTREDKICYFDRDYTVDSDDIISSRVFPKNISVVNAKNAILGCNEDFTVDANAVENDVSNPFLNAIKDRYTIDENSGQFIGFPTCIVYDNIIYVFYRVADKHESIPGQEQDKFFYRWSADGVNWSALNEITFAGCIASDHTYDYRGVFPFEYNGNLYCFIQVATSYIDRYDEHGDPVWEIGWYLGGVAKLLKREDNTIEVGSQQEFPSIDMEAENDNIDFNSHFPDGNFKGIVVG